MILNFRKIVNSASKVVAKNVCSKPACFALTMRWILF